MNGELISLIELLTNNVNSDNFIEVAYEVTDRLEGKDFAYDAIQPILELMEKNPGVDFGAPGPLVHFIENYQYKEQLIQSLHRRPTEHTVWMLNRMINASTGECKEELLEELRKVVEHPKADDSTIATSRDFIEFQVGN